MALTKSIINQSDVPVSYWKVSQVTILVPEKKMTAFLSGYVSQEASSEGYHPVEKRFFEIEVTDFSSISIPILQYVYQHIVATSEFTDAINS